MKISIVRPIRFKKDDRTIELGDGINTFNPPLDILDSQATDSRNMISTKYPAATVRNGKTDIGTGSQIFTPRGMGQRNNQYLHFVNSGIWKYWDGSKFVTVDDTLSPSTNGNFGEFSTGTTKNTIFSNGTDRKSWDGSILTDLTNAPLSSVFITHKGRVYWARDNDIVFSALNDINDYTSINNAGTIDVTRAKGKITSLYEYNDKVNVFTEFSIHELYGTGPSNYNLVDIEGAIGNISHKGTVVCNKCLYWIWYDGIYEYNGASVVKVSEPYGANGVNGGVTNFIKNIKLSLRDKIVGGSNGDFLYMSIPYGESATGNNITLIFDTKLRKWYIHNEGFIYFETIGNILYGMDTSGYTWDLTTTATKDGANPIAWYFITKAFNEGTPSSKTTITELWLVFDLPIGSTMKVEYSNTIDNNDFADLYTFTASANEQNQRVQIPITKLQNVNFYRLKFSGTGPATIYQLEKKGRVNYNNG